MRCIARRSLLSSRNRRLYRSAVRDTPTSLAARRSESPLFFTRNLEVDLKPIEEAFAERVLAQLHKRELISDEDVAQILSQDHTGFGVWLGDPFHDKESEQFVARYIERAPLD